MMFDGVPGGPGQRQDKGKEAQESSPRPRGVHLALLRPFWASFPLFTDGYGTPTPPLANLQLCFGLVLAAEKDMVDECVGIMTRPTQMNVRPPLTTPLFS